jgi:hypothetical protein
MSLFRPDTTDFAELKGSVIVLTGILCVAHFIGRSLTTDSDQVDPLVSGLLL